MSKVKFKLQSIIGTKKVAKYWARVITRYDSSKKHVFKFAGEQWVHTNETIELPEGSTILFYEFDANTDVCHVALILTDKNNIHGRLLRKLAIPKFRSQHWLAEFGDWDGTVEEQLKADLDRQWSKEKYSTESFDSPEAAKEAAQKICNYVLYESSIATAKKLKAYLGVAHTAVCNTVRELESRQ